MSHCFRSIVVALLAGTWACASAPPTPTSSTTGGAGEAPQPAAVEETEVPKPTPLRTASFSDGSGNRYTFQSQSVESTGHMVYDPVTPEQSSSGTYSGGEPADVALSVEQNTELWQRLATLQANEAIAVTARSMGSGSFEITGPDGSVRFLIGMGPELSEFVAFLEQLRP